MTLKIYNTLTRKKELFKEIEKGKVSLYTCGPTVYYYAHIGNLRTFVFGDILRRYLRYKGYAIRHVMNITDVDDKTIRDSHKEGISLSKFTAKYSKAFGEDLDTLNIEHPEVFPKATAHINEMLEIIKDLMDKGIAYRASDGSVYFSVDKFKGYGKLSGVKIENLKSGARVSHDEYDKDNASDFALWKAWDEKDGNVFWKTDIGKGRPGWHIECSAMSMKYLGESFDIHAGGVDLIFPHHENEIAQSEAHTGKKFVNYWMHAEHLIVEGKKMSKSLGNFYTLRDLMDHGRDPIAIRYLFMSTHYRQQLNFTLDSLDAAENSVERLNNFMNMLYSSKGKKKHDEVKDLVKDLEKGFEKSMDDDLNISAALGHIFDFIREINSLEGLSKKDAQIILKGMKKIDSVLGILDTDPLEIAPDIKQLLAQREEARKMKNWEESDILRNEIEKRGWLVEDTPDGPRLKKK